MRGKSKLIAHISFILLKNRSSNMRFASLRNFGFGLLPLLVETTIMVSVSGQGPVTTPKPTNAERVGRHDHHEHGPRPSLTPVVVTHHPSAVNLAGDPTATPSFAPVTKKPNNPRRAPLSPLFAQHRGPTKNPADTAPSTPSSPIDLISSLIANTIGCPNAASDLSSSNEGTSTYQSKAANQTLAFLSGSPTATPAQLVQYYALACFYYATSGQRWLNNANWVSLSDFPCGVNNAWYGVTCDSVSEKVISLKITSNFVSGTLPCEVNLLSADHPSQAGALELLNLSTNTALYTSGSSGSQWFTGLGSAMSKCRFFIDHSSRHQPSTVQLTDLQPNLTYLRRFSARQCLLTLARAFPTCKIYTLTILTFLVIFPF